MKLKNKDCFRNAVESDISSVAQIHREAFKGFFLSQLGYKFLCVMYLAFLRSPNSLFVVYESPSGVLSGFAVGAFRGQSDRWLAIRFLPQFIVAVAPAIWRDPRLVLKRLWTRFFDTDETPQLPIDAAELRSIAVLPALRGSGCSNYLLQAFEDLAHGKGVSQVVLTTDEVNNDRVQRYYARAGYKTVTKFKQNGKRQMLLMCKSICSEKSPIKFDLL